MIFAEFFCFFFVWLILQINILIWTPKRQTFSQDTRNLWRGSWCGGVVVLPPRNKNILRRVFQSPSRSTRRSGAHDPSNCTSCAVEVRFDGSWCASRQRMHKLRYFDQRRGDCAAIWSRLRTSDSASTTFWKELFLNWSLRLFEPVTQKHKWCFGWVINKTNLTSSWKQTREKCLTGAAYWRLIINKYSQHKYEILTLMLRQSWGSHLNKVNFNRKCLQMTPRTEGCCGRNSRHLTCDHQGEVETFFHWLPVHLVGQRCKTNVIFFLKAIRHTKKISWHSQTL